MRFIDYDDMPNKDLEFWLKSIADEIQSDNKGFANVKALRLGAISTALKRLDDLWTAGHQSGGNYTANDSTFPTEITFQNGRKVGIAFDGDKPYLTVGIVE